jgi:hypothetical protein
MLGKGSKSAIGTLIERQTRYVMLLNLAEGRLAEQFRAKLAERILTLPDHFRQSLTWGRGKEMAGHARFTVSCRPWSHRVPELKPQVPRPTKARRARALGSVRRRERTSAVLAVVGGVDARIGNRPRAAARASTLALFRNRLSRDRLRSSDVLQPKRRKLLDVLLGRGRLEVERIERRVPRRLQRGWRTIATPRCPRSRRGAPSGQAS